MIRWYQLSPKSYWYSIQSFSRVRSWSIRYFRSSRKRGVSVRAHVIHPGVGKHEPPLALGEHVEMTVVPTHDHLQGIVQPGQPHRRRDEKAAPDRRPGSLEGDSELVGVAGGLRISRRHGLVPVRGDRNAIATRPSLTRSAPAVCGRTVTNAGEVGRGWEPDAHISGRCRGAGPARSRSPRRLGLAYEGVNSAAHARQR